MRVDAPWLRAAGWSKIAGDCSQRCNLARYRHMRVSLRPANAGAGPDMADRSRALVWLFGNSRVSETGFPRCNHRGPIEAIYAVAAHPVTNNFPRCDHRGPIEANRHAARGGQQDRAGCCTAASLLDDLL